MLVAEIVLSVEITGAPDLTTAVRNALATMDSELAGPLMEEAEEILAVSREIVPVDEGVLRNSALAVGINPTKESDGTWVRFGYGGAAGSYALLQHETPPNVFRHAEGKMWKYLETPVYSAVATMGPRLAGRLSARFTARLAGGAATGGSGATFGDGGE